MNNFSWLTERPIAHRGLYSEKGVPENSMAAFEAAVNGNYGIELDVQVTASGEVVVFHDDDLRRMCGTDKRVSQLTIENYSLYPLRGTSQRIPLLRDVLDFVGGKVALLIEIKRGSPHPDPNLMVLNALLGYEGHLAIQSFDPFILHWFVRNAPGIPRAQLSSDFRDPEFKHGRLNGLVKLVLRRMWLNSLSKPHIIAYDVRGLPDKRIQKARSAGKPVLGWTVTNSGCADKARQYCDNIIFEQFNPA